MLKIWGDQPLFQWLTLEAQVQNSTSHDHKRGLTT